ncbi:unnamed protein product [Microthlaspi erraticum]|uniref:Transmembrane protein n=1 Tax=Microthlaspi erraticum TaxID=1685480 RepID=A0A6D2JQG3_9BRAS|nr:unnamed protein product [Microthlaspi erraticum]
MDTHKADLLKEKENENLEDEARVEIEVKKLQKMEKKINVFVMCVIFLLVGSSLMLGRVDCRALRSKLLRDINGQDQSTVAMKVKKASSSQGALMRSYGFRLASGPSRRGRGH